MLQPMPEKILYPATNYASHESNTSRDNLIRLISAANNNSNVEDRIKEYETILERADLFSLLKKEEISDIFWNKSLDHAQIADQYFNSDITGRQQLVPAFRHQNLAISDMKMAQSLYDKVAYSDMAEEQITQMQAALEIILVRLNAAAAVIGN